ncbi:MAG: hypothetical protein HQL82_16725 [Magnetococcales bacterium]|nr:hypothetical protein [Magnetococcales bacterium]
MDWLFNLLDQPFLSWMLAILLLLWGLVATRRFIKGELEPLERRLGEFLHSLEGSPAKRMAFAERFPDLDARLSRIPDLGGRWAAYRDTLILREDNLPVLGSCEPERFFNENTLIRDRAGWRRFEAVPGLQVGAGLAVTILGSIITVLVAPSGGQGAGVVVHGLTTLSGLLGALIFYRFGKRCQNAMERRVVRIRELLDERIERITAPKLLWERQEAPAAVSTSAERPVAAAWGDGAELLRLASAVQDNGARLLRIQEVLQENLVALGARLQTSIPPAGEAPDFQELVRHLERSSEVQDRRFGEEVRQALEQFGSGLSAQTGQWAERLGPALLEGLGRANKDLRLQVSEGNELLRRISTQLGTALTGSLAGSGPGREDSPGPVTIEPLLELVREEMDGNRAALTDALGTVTRELQDHVGRGHDLLRVIGERLERIENLPPTAAPGDSTRAMERLVDALREEAARWRDGPGRALGDGIAALLRAREEVFPGQERLLESLEDLKRHLQRLPAGEGEAVPMTSASREDGAPAGGMDRVVLEEVLAPLAGHVSQANDLLERIGQSLERAVGADPVGPGLQALRDSLEGLREEHRQHSERLEGAVLRVTGELAGRLGGMEWHSGEIKGLMDRLLAQIHARAEGHQALLDRIATLLGSRVAAGEAADMALADELRRQGERLEEAFRRGTDELGGRLGGVAWHSGEIKGLMEQLLGQVQARADSQQGRLDRIAALLENTATAAAPAGLDETLLQGLREALVELGRELQERIASGNRLLERIGAGLEQAGAHLEERLEGLKTLADTPVVEQMRAAGESLIAHQRATLAHMLDVIAAGLESLYGQEAERLRQTLAGLTEALQQGAKLTDSATGHMLTHLMEQVERLERGQAEENRRLQELDQPFMALARFLKDNVSGLERAHLALSSPSPSAREPSPSPVSRPASVVRKAPALPLPLAESEQSAPPAVLPRMEITPPARPAPGPGQPVPLPDTLLAAFFISQHRERASQHRERARQHRKQE